MKRVYQVTDLKEELSHRLTSEQMAEIEIPYYANPEMVEFAHRITRGNTSSVSKAVAIVDAIMSQWELDIVYDIDVDLTAEAAFKHHRANCLTFTNLFVSLSRAVGMHTVYVDVTQIEDIFVEGAFVINSGHICAGLYDGAQFYLIDFSPAAEKHYKIYREIDDMEAVANHYNNKAYRYSLKNKQDIEQAMAYYRIAAAIKPDFSKVLNNMGVASVLLGNLSEAEAYYLDAIQHSASMHEPYYNLGSLYFSRGDYAKSARYLERTVELKPRNPHYRYALGLTYMHAGRDERSEKQFKAAVRIDKSHSKSLIGLALLALKADRTGWALHYFDLALKSDPQALSARIHRSELIEKIAISNL